MEAQGRAGEVRRLEGAEAVGAGGTVAGVGCGMRSRPGMERVRREEGKRKKKKKEGDKGGT